MKNFRDLYNTLSTAERKGRAEGEAIGIAKGERALLTKLILAKKVKGCTPSEIADMLGIDVKIVEEILKESC